MNSRQHQQKLSSCLAWCSNICELFTFDIRMVLRITWDRVLAISNVPVLSMLAAIIGIPLYTFLEFRKVISLFRSTYSNIQFRVHVSTYFNGVFHRLLLWMFVRMMVEQQSNQLPGDTIQCDRELFRITKKFKIQINVLYYY